MISANVPQRFARSRTDRRHRILIAILAVPFLLGLLGAPVASPGAVQGDELSRAQAQQKELKQKIAAQKALIARLNGSQASLAGAIAQTKDELAGITDNLAATRKRVAKLVDNINEVKAEYQDLVNQLSDLDHQLGNIEAQETAKKAELGQRKAELADRIRQAYEAERTSMLETFLSGASFTDMLAEMSTQLDAAEQDKALAAQIAEDRETLLALHQTVDDTRAQTNVLRQETAVQKQKLDQRLDELKKAQAKLKKLERAAKAALAAQKARYAQIAANKASVQRALKATAAAKKKLEKRIDNLVARQYNLGNIPSKFNGTLRWPMGGTVTQPFGCTGVIWEPPNGDCAHWHNGIDIVAPYGTAVRASGAGRVVYIGWNYADGADPAWIVIIAHSSNLTTWYAHMQPRYPVRAGQVVSKGQVIGYEGSTGHSTGAHLHWMVQYNGTFVNPRLFT
ncbi:MAG TPA: peptidoglycan DD-metalloendopeptidase family protein [Candidatus Limnocylindrales bacterium]|nr:peptidoglycan DD-metalloendopeptidase family protein [Candidatus Limnocylindrales bacterium]